MYALRATGETKFFVFYPYGDENVFEGAQNVTIFGHGTISGDRLPHPTYSDLPEDEHWRYR